MADITMCAGNGCDRKPQCYRHTAKPNEFLQSYFASSPIDVLGGCEHFMANDPYRDVPKVQKR